MKEDPLSSKKEEASLMLTSEYVAPEMSPAWSNRGVPTIFSDTAPSTLTFGVVPPSEDANIEAAATLVLFGTDGPAGGIG